MNKTLARDADLFNALVSLRSLDAAWDKVRANGGCAGGDGVTIARFLPGAGRRLAELSAALSSGEYRPRPLRIARIPKPSGGERPLSIPSIIDRVAQTSAAMVLSPILDETFSEASFAYRPGRSVDMAVRAVGRWRDLGYTHVVEADIVRCFERIPNDAVLNSLDEVLSGREGASRLLDLVALWCESASQALGSPGRGLAQGSPLSPLLANLHLDRLDDALERRGMRLVRFADDFVILCKSRTIADRALEEAGDVLEDEGLELRRDRTRIVDFERGFTFLGHLFVRSMTLRRVSDPDEDAIVWMRRISEDDDEGAATAEAKAAKTASQLARGYDEGRKTLYLNESGRRLTLRNMSFAVMQRTEEGERELIAVNASRIGRIELGPLADVETEALRIAMAHDIEVAFVSGAGETEGWLTHPDFDRAGLHLAQARVATEPCLAAGLAKRIVEGRIRNQRAQLRLLNRRKEDGEADAAAAELSRSLQKLGDAETVEEARGHEGRAAAIYWPALARLAGHEGAFVRDRPARSPLNATLNYLTAILSREVRAAMVGRGLHPGFGVLHVARDRGEAGVWDLMEGFRAPLTEGLAVSLFNQKRLKADMFEASGDGVRIRPEARRAIIRGYEAAASRLTTSSRSGRRRMWRALIDDDAAAYAAHCLDPAGRPFMTHLVDH